MYIKSRDTKKSPSRPSPKILFLWNLGSLCARKDFCVVNTSLLHCRTSFSMRTCVSLLTGQATRRYVQRTDSIPAPVVVLRTCGLKSSATELQSRPPWEEADKVILFPSGGPKAHEGARFQGLACIHAANRHEPSCFNQDKHPHQQLQSRWPLSTSSFSSDHALDMQPTTRWCWAVRTAVVPQQPEIQYSCQTVLCIRLPGRAGGAQSRTRPL